MCRPKLHFDREETPTAPVSLEASDFLSFMSRDKGSQQLAGSQQPRHDDENNFLRVDALNFDTQLPLQKISPTGLSDINFPRTVCNCNEPREVEPNTKLTVKPTGKKGKIERPVIIVQHNYHDHSHEKEIDYPLLQPKSRGGVSIPFPLKLHDMLDQAMAEGYGDIVSWQPHGRCFVVYKAREFQDIVLPKYFKLNKMSSFQRQLNLYGFQRLTFGRDRGGYYHERFLRHKNFLARGIKRVQVKGTGVRARSNPEQEPNFWAMKWCDPAVVNTEKSNSSEREPSIPHQSQSTPQQELNNFWTMADLEPIDIRTMQWGDSNITSSSNGHKENHDGNCGIVSTWSVPIELEDLQSYQQKTLAFPKDFQPLPTHCGSLGAQANNDDLFDSFGEGAYPLMNQNQNKPEGPSMVSNNSGGLGNSLYSDSFGFQIY